MRYMSAPQRSHRIFSSAGGVVFNGDIGRTGGGGEGGSAIRRIIAWREIVH
jgi:hypothetical protein